MPVPGMALRSRLCSAAILRTSGVDLRRRRSSALSPTPLGPPTSPKARLGELVSGAARLGAGEGRDGAACGGAGGAGGAAAEAGFSGTGARGGGTVGAGAEAGDAEATAPASVSMVATTVWTATV